MAEEMTTKIDGKIVQISAPHFTAGIIVDDVTGIVVAAAPILQWTLDKSVESVVKWAMNHGYDIEEVG